MLETGMRVGDAIRYDPRLVAKGEHLWIYTYLPQKQRRTEKPKPLEAYIPDRLKQAIDSCESTAVNGYHQSCRSSMERVGIRRTSQMRYTNGCSL